MIRDLLTAGYQDWDAAVRIELYDRHGRRFNVEHEFYAHASRASFASTAQDKDNEPPAR